MRGKREGLRVKKVVLLVGLSLESFEVGREGEVKRGQLSWLREKNFVSVVPH